MVGQNIGKYRVLDRVGRGGMGTVYRAIDETLHREVAIKVLNAELNDPVVARRFRAEAVTVARLSHPGLATVYELLQHEGQWLMVMEFVRGETFEDLVARKGPLPVEQAAELCMQALGALAHAHSMGVVHRDLKPANLMTTASGTVKIMDFGIARVVGTEHLTNAGFLMGTPAYMAPEQVMGAEIDARADLYAMGVVLYHLTTAKLPFRGDTPFQVAQSRLRDEPTPVRSVRGELPAWLGDVMALALARLPEQRFQSAPILREALRRGLANLPIETPVATSVPPELIATAAPRDLPIPAGLASPPVRVLPSRVPATSTPAVLASDAAVEPKRRPVWLMIAAGGVAVAALTGWLLLTGAGDTPQSAPADASSAPAGSGTALTSPAAPPTDSALSAVAPPPAAGPSSAVSGDIGGSDAKPAAHGRASAETALAFPALRAVVVNGRRAEEQPAVLHLFSGQVSVVLDPGGTTLASIPYRELARATYTRARTPRWDATLAAPAANVDMPGGLFRGTRHWLTLQSRATYAVLRLNDGDWRQVVDQVAGRTGVKIDLPVADR